MKTGIERPRAVVPPLVAGSPIVIPAAIGAIALGWAAVHLRPLIGLTVAALSICLLLGARRQLRSNALPNYLLAFAVLITVAVSLVGPSTPSIMGLAAPLAVVASVILLAKRVFILLALLLLWSLPVLLSQHLAAGDHSIVGISLRFLAPLAVLLLFLTGYDSRIVTRAWIPGVSLAVSVAVSQFAWPNHSDLSLHAVDNYSRTDGSLRSFGFASNPNEFGLVAAVSVLSLLYLARGRFLGRVPTALLALGCSVAVLNSGTRSAVISLILGVVSFAVVSSSNAKRNLATSLVAVPLLAFAWLSNITVGGRPLFGSVGEDGSSTFRAATLTSLRNRTLAGEAPLFGYGVENGNQLRQGKLNADLPNIDNSFYYVLIAFGLVAAVLLVSFVLALLLRVTVVEWRALPIVLALIPAYLLENSVSSPTFTVALTVSLWSYFVARGVPGQRAVPPENRKYEPSAPGASRL